MADVEVDRIFLDIGTAKFDLTFFVYEHEGGLRITIEYSTELFEETTVVRMGEQLKTLLETIVRGPDQRVAAIPMLPEEERRQVLEQWNETQAAYPRDACVHRARFSAGPARPGAPARWNSPASD